MSFRELKYLTRGQQIVKRLWEVKKKDQSFVGFERRSEGEGEGDPFYWKLLSVILAFSSLVSIDDDDDNDDD